MTHHDEAGLHPGYLELRPFVFHDASGRITGAGVQGWKASEDLLPAGQRLLFASADIRTDYVEGAGEGARVVPRPTFDAPFSAPSVPAGVETVLPGLPACTITFSGPETGTHAHPGGDLEVGFMSPGDYVIAAEPFPYLAFTRSLTVTA